MCFTVINQYEVLGIFTKIQQKYPTLLLVARFFNFKYGKFDFGSYWIGLTLNEGKLDMILKNSDGNDITSLELIAFRVAKKAGRAELAGLMRLDNNQLTLGKFKYELDNSDPGKPCVVYDGKRNIGVLAHTPDYNKQNQPVRNATNPLGTNVDFDNYYRVYLDKDKPMLEMELNCGQELTGLRAEIRRVK
jgi:hypothetical protein